MYKVGYSDEKAFRKITGISPLEYRKNIIKMCLVNKLVYDFIKNVPLKNYDIRVKNSNISSK